jgi:hypothetical protein
MGTEARIYSVPGISCEHCKRTIEGGLGQFAGVTAVEVNVPDKQVRVEGPADPDAVSVLLGDLGYAADGSVPA